MDIQEYRKKIESIDNPESIYLLEQLSTEAGFFSTDRKFVFLIRDDSNYNYEGVETEYLRLQTHLRISAVNNHQSFKDDYYNLILYKGDFSDQNIYSFVHLCSIYASRSNELDFKEFFYSLITLFQLQEEQKYKNALGLFGELKLMLYAKETLGIDMSHCWHKDGSFSKFDFSNGSNNLEIKTSSLEENEVLIKHDQIFGIHPCKLVVMSCEEYTNGETIEDLVAKLYDYSDAFNSIQFSINLTKELKRLSDDDIRNKKFLCKKISFYSTDIINPFPLVPDTIRKMNYILDLSDFDSLSETEMNEIIKSFG